MQLPHKKQMQMKLLKVPHIINVTLSGVCETFTGMHVKLLRVFHTFKGMSHFQGNVKL